MAKETTKTTLKPYDMYNAQRNEAREEKEVKQQEELHRFVEKKKVETF